MYEALKQEGYTPKEARDKIKKDAFNIWKVETIDKWIPQEAKQEIKVIAGQKGGLAKSEQTTNDSARQESSKNQDSDISLTDEEIQRIAETEKITEPQSHSKEELDAMMESDAQAMDDMNRQAKELVEKQDTPRTKDVDERDQIIEVIHLSGHETGNLFMSMMQKKNYWKYADNVAFEWNKTKKTLRLILN